MLTQEEQRWAKMIVLYPRRFGRLAGAMCTLLEKVGHLLSPEEMQYYLALTRGIDIPPLNCHNPSQGNGDSQLQQPEQHNNSNTNQDKGTAHA